VKGSTPVIQEDRSLATSRHGSISRTPKVNAEASNLRSQIATKEFELARLEKLFKKQPASESASLQKQILLLLDDLKKLKAQYLRLTGVDYENSSKRSRERVQMGGVSPKTRVQVDAWSAGLGQPPATPAARSVQAYQPLPVIKKEVSEQPSVLGAESPKPSREIPFPPHWVQSRYNSISPTAQAHLMYS
jgi:hypothetical protein